METSPSDVFDFYTVLQARTVQLRQDKAFECALHVFSCRMGHIRSFTCWVVGGEGQFGSHPEGARVGASVPSLVPPSVPPVLIGGGGGCRPSLRCCSMPHHSHPLQV